MVVGLIFRCRNRKYVKIQGSGQINQGINMAAGFMGHEITSKGKDVGKWLYWDAKGNNTYDREWDLMKSNAGADPVVLQGRGWPENK